MAIRLNTGRSSIDSTPANKTPAYKNSLWAGGFAVFFLSILIGLKTLGNHLYLKPSSLDEIKNITDSAIICLAGGKGRIEAAFELYASGVGDSLYIVGAGPKTTLTSLLRNISPATYQKISVDRRAKISLEIESRNTIENAYVVDRYLLQNPQIKSVILLTSAYHMKRSLFILQQLSKREVRFLIFPPAHDSLNGTNWAQSLLGLQVTAQEIFKYAVAKILIPQMRFF